MVARVIVNVYICVQIHLHSMEIEKHCVWTDDEGAGMEVKRNHIYTSIHVHIIFIPMSLSIYVSFLCLSL